MAEQQAPDLAQLLALEQSQEQHSFSSERFRRQAQELFGAVSPQLLAFRQEYSQDRQQQIADLNQELAQTSGLIRSRQAESQIDTARRAAETDRFELDQELFDLQMRLYYLESKTRGVGGFLNRSGLPKMLQGMRKKPTQETDQAAAPKPKEELSFAEMVAERDSLIQDKADKEARLAELGQEITRQVEALEAAKANTQATFGPKAATESSAHVYYTSLQRQLGLLEQEAIGDIFDIEFEEITQQLEAGVAKFLDAETLRFQKLAEADPILSQLMKMDAKTQRVFHYCLNYAAQLNAEQVRRAILDQVSNFNEGQDVAVQIDLLIATQANFLLFLEQLSTVPGEDRYRIMRTVFQILANRGEVDISTVDAGLSQYFDTLTPEEMSFTKDFEIPKDKVYLALATADNLPAESQRQADAVLYRSIRILYDENGMRTLLPIWQRMSESTRARLQELDPEGKLHTLHVFVVVSSHIKTSLDVNTLLKNLKKTTFFDAVVQDGGQLILSEQAIHELYAADLSISVKDLILTETTALRLQLTPRQKGYYLLMSSPVRIMSDDAKHALQNTILVDEKNVEITTSGEQVLVQIAPSAFDKNPATTLIALNAVEQLAEYTEATLEFVQLTEAEQVVVQFLLDMQYKGLPLSSNILRAASQTLTRVGQGYETDFQFLKAFFPAFTVTELAKNSFEDQTLRKLISVLLNTESSIQLSDTAQQQLWQVAEDNQAIAQILGRKTLKDEGIFVVRNPFQKDGDPLYSVRTSDTADPVVVLHDFKVSANSAGNQISSEYPSRTDFVALFELIRQGKIETTSPKLLYFMEFQAQLSVLSDQLLAENEELGRLFANVVEQMNNNELIDSLFVVASTTEFDQSTLFMMLLTRLSYHQLGVVMQALAILKPESGIFVGVLQQDLQNLATALDNPEVLGICVRQILLQEVFPQITEGSGRNRDEFYYFSDQRQFMVTLAQGTSAYLGAALLASKKQLEAAGYSVMVTEAEYKEDNQPYDLHAIDIFRTALVAEFGEEPFLEERNFFRMLRFLVQSGLVTISNDESPQADLQTVYHVRVSEVAFYYIHGSLPRFAQMLKQAQSLGARQIQDSQSDQPVSVAFDRIVVPAQLGNFDDGIIANASSPQAILWMADQIERNVFMYDDSLKQVTVGLEVSGFYVGRGARVGAGTTQQLEQLIALPLQYRDERWRLGFQVLLFLNKVIQRQDLPSELVDEAEALREVLLSMEANFKHLCQLLQVSDSAGSDTAATEKTVLMKMEHATLLTDDGYDTEWFGAVRGPTPLKIGFRLRKLLLALQAETQQPVAIESEVSPTLNLLDKIEQAFDQKVQGSGSSAVEMLSDIIDFSVPLQTERFTAAFSDHGGRVVANTRFLPLLAEAINDNWSQKDVGVREVLSFMKAAIEIGLIPSSSLMAFSPAENVLWQVVLGENEYLAMSLAESEFFGLYSAQLIDDDNNFIENRQQRERHRQQKLAELADKVLTRYRHPQSRVVELVVKPELLAEFARSDTTLLRGILQAGGQVPPMYEVLQRLDWRFAADDRQMRAFDILADFSQDNSMSRRLLEWFGFEPDEALSLVHALEEQATGQKSWKQVVQSLRNLLRMEQRRTPLDLLRVMISDVPQVLTDTHLNGFVAAMSTAMMDHQVPLETVRALYIRVPSILNESVIQTQKAVSETMTEWVVEDEDFAFLNNMIGTHGDEVGGMIRGYSECLTQGVLQRGKVGRDILLAFTAEFRVVNPAIIQKYVDARQAQNEQMFMSGLRDLARRMLGVGEVTAEDRALSYFNDLTRALYPNNSGDNWTNFEKNERSQPHPEHLARFEFDPEYELVIMAGGGVRLKDGQKLKEKEVDAITRRVMSLSEGIDMTGGREAAQKRYDDGLVEALEKVIDSSLLVGFPLDRLTDPESDGKSSRDQWRSEVLFILVLVSTFDSDRINRREMQRLMLQYEFIFFADIAEYVNGTRDRVGSSPNPEYSLLMELHTLFTDRFKDVNAAILQAAFANPAIQEHLPILFQQVSRSVAQQRRQQLVSSLRIDGLGLNDAFIERLHHQLKKKGYDYTPQQIARELQRYERVTRYLQDEDRAREVLRRAGIELSGQDEATLKMVTGQLRSQRNKTLEAMEKLTDTPQILEQYLGEMDVAGLAEAEVQVLELDYDHQMFASFMLQRMLDVFQHERDIVEREADKYESIDGTKPTKLSAVFTKSSPHTRQVGGVCVAGDNTPDERTMMAYEQQHGEPYVSMWDQENYFELALFDPEVLRSVGLLLIHYFEENGERILTVSMNPSSTYLYKVDEAALFHALMEPLEDFARRNNIDKIGVSRIKEIRTNRTGGIFERTMDERIAQVGQEYTFSEKKVFSRKPPYFMDVIDLIWVRE